MKKIIAILSVVILTVSAASAKEYYASSFGIKSNGSTLNTRAIQAAIDFISAEGGGTLTFKVGRYLTGSIHLKSNVTLNLSEGAILVGSTNPYDYDKVDNTLAFVIADSCENIAITGLGVIDGQGRELANNYITQITQGFIKDQFTLGRPFNRPHCVYLFNSKNVTLQGINIRSSACWTCTTNCCDNLLIDHVTVDSRAFWNNDGLDIVDCTNTTVQNCFINATDDGICLKSHRANKLCNNVVIKDNVITSSASGIKFGTFGVGGFRNITLTGNTVYDTFRSAIAIESVDGGIAENIVVDGLKSLNTANAIYLVVGQRRGEKKSTMKNVTIRNVYAEIPTDKPDYGYDYEGPTLEDEPRNICPCAIVGLEGQNVENVLIENVEVRFPGGGDSSYACVKTSELDKVPEMPKAYPEFSQFKELPAWGFYIRHASGVTFKNVTLSAAAKDYRPAVVLDDVADSDFKGLKATAPSLKKKIFVAGNCKNIKK